MGRLTNVSKIIQEGADYVVINYDGIGIVLDDLKKGGFDLNYYR